MTLTDQLKEILTDIHGDPGEVMRRAAFLDEAMPMITETLTHTYDAVAPMISMVALLQGCTPEEIGAKVRENALQGSFALGVMMGLELQKRGYVPPVNTDLDVPQA